jgi:hypothetical protein
MPLGTVKTHARRGLIKIRQILADQGVLSPDDLPREFTQSQRDVDEQDSRRIRGDQAAETARNPSLSRGEPQP